MGLLINGGWVLWVLLGLSVASLAISIQKYWVLSVTRIQSNFVQSIKTQLSTDAKDAVLKQLRYSRRIESQLAGLAIEKHAASDAVISAEVNRAIQLDYDALQSKMGFLSMVITVAPVLGLLGTVLGLMDVFSVLSVEGVGDPRLLSAGISKALITTVAGLSLAIPLMFVHQYLSQQIHRRITRWNQITTQLVAHLRG